MLVSLAIIGEKQQEVFDFANKFYANAGKVDALQKQMMSLVQFNPSLGNSDLRSLNNTDCVCFFCQLFQWNQCSVGAISQMFLCCKLVC